MSQKLGPETRAIIDAINRMGAEDRKGNLNYQTITIDLGTAHTDTVYELPGIFDHISVLKIDGAVTLKLEKNTNNSIDLTLVRCIDSVFMRFYLTNIAQTGSTLVLEVGGDASFTIDPLLPYYTDFAVPQDVKEGFDFTELWESGIFDKRKYLGRMGPYFKSEADANIRDRAKWTTPTFAKGVNVGWDWPNAIQMINSKDGATVDQVYFAVPQSFKRSVLAFSGKWPILASLLAGTVIAAGWECSTKGGQAAFYLKGANGAYTLNAALVSKDGLIGSWVAVTLAGTAAWTGYILELDPPYLRLWEGGILLGALKFDATTDMIPYVTPFFCNESNTVVNDFWIGDFAVWRIEDSLKPMINDQCSQVVSTNAMVSALKVRCRFNHKLVIHLKEHATNAICYQIRASMDDVTYFTILNYTLLPTSDVQFQTVTDPWIWIDVQIMDAVSGTHGKLDCTIGGS